MTTMTMGAFPPRPAADRNAFLWFVGLVWVGVLSGFGTDSFNHVSKHGLDYPWIVHLHAVTFVSWLALFTAQVALIRNGRPDLHRRLGVVGAGLAGLMLILGPATAITVDAARFAAKGETPEFLAVQLTDMAAFGVLTGAGLLLRANAAAHKRLLLLGLFFLSDAGFARFLNGPIAQTLGDNFWGEMFALYGFSTLLMLALGAYDLITRRRLHPAYLASLAFVVAVELTAQHLLHDPTWKALSMHLIGR